MQVNFQNDGGSSCYLIAAHGHHCDYVRGDTIVKLLTVEHLFMHVACRFVGIVVARVAALLVVV